LLHKAQVGDGALPDSSIVPVQAGLIQSPDRKCSQPA
jgi:hypothetical protein